MCEAWRSAPDAERSRPNAIRQIRVPAADDRRLPRVPWWLRVGLSLVILGLTVWFVVVPQFAEARRAAPPVAVTHPAVIGGMPGPGYRRQEYSFSGRPGVPYRGLRSTEPESARYSR